MSKPQPPPPSSHPLANVWGDSGNDASSSSFVRVYYMVRHPWQWVFQSIATKRMHEISSVADLPSMKSIKASVSTTNLNSNNDTSHSNNNNNDNTSPMHRRVASMSAMSALSTPRRRRGSMQQRTQQLKANLPSTLRLDICDPPTGKLIFAAHGTSAAFDGLEDKDELVRTMQRCRCDHLHLSPPSILINWDVTHDECSNVIGNKLPSLLKDDHDDDNDNQQQLQKHPQVAVLKEPMGSQGQGVYFVTSVSDIHKIIDDHHKRALAEPQLLDNLIASKGRIPSFVLQAEVRPCLLIRNRRKFHIRTYVVLVEDLKSEDLMTLYVYNQHEVRIAGVPVDDDNADPSTALKRNRAAHITNGALSDTTERVLLSDVEELQQRGMQDKVDCFVAQLFMEHLYPDLSRRVSYSASMDNSSSNNYHSDDGGSGGSHHPHDGQQQQQQPVIHKFAVAGLDLMVTEENRIYLLEVNSNPAAPPEDTIDAKFRSQLRQFMHQLVDLVVGFQPTSNFVAADTILDRHGL